MQFEFIINYDNDNLLEADEPEECARILRVVARDIEHGTSSEGPCFDRSGNVVGRFVLIKE